MPLGFSSATTNINQVSREGDLICVILGDNIIEGSIRGSGRCISSTGRRKLGSTEGSNGRESLRSGRDCWRPDLCYGRKPHTPNRTTAMSYPGTIKAFHFHMEQTDFWVPVRGMLQVAPVDLRPDSGTFGVTNAFYVSELRPWQVLIPPGVGHGYKVVSRDPAMLVYLTNRFYNPSDDGRIAYNDTAMHTIGRRNTNETSGNGWPPDLLDLLLSGWS